MNRLLMLGFLIFSVVGCTSVNSTRPTKSKAQVQRQHFQLMALSSLYFCEHQKWSYDLIDLKEFSTSQKLVPTTDIDWNWALSPSVQYRTSPAFSLSSFSANGKGGVVELTSRQEKPNCGQHGVQSKMEWQEKDQVAID